LVPTSPLRGLLAEHRLAQLVHIAGIIDRRVNERAGNVLRLGEWEPQPGNEPFLLRADQQPRIAARHFLGGALPHE
jgi:hypothetical protein